MQLGQGLPEQGCCPHANQRGDDESTQDEPVRVPRLPPHARTLRSEGNDLRPRGRQFRHLRSPPV
jgi:hypothetical protein